MVEREKELGTWAACYSLILCNLETSVMSAPVSTPTHLIIFSNLPTILNRD